MSEWHELSDSWLSERPTAQCNRCGRSTWDDPSIVGQEDRMTQPDGNPCGGRFCAVVAPVRDAEGPQNAVQGREQIVPAWVTQAMDDHVDAAHERMRQLMAMGEPTDDD